MIHVTRDPDQSAARRRTAVLVVGNTILLSGALWLLHLPTALFAVTLALAVAVQALRAFGPGTLDSAHEYALILVGEHAQPVVDALRRDPELRSHWQRVGVDVAGLAGMAASSVDDAAASLRRAVRPRARWWEWVGAALVGAVIVSVGAAGVDPADLSTGTLVVLVGVAVAVVAGRLALARRNENVRDHLRHHLATDPPVLVAAELTAILAPADLARRRAVTDYLGFLIDPTRIVVSVVTRAAALVPALLIGGAAGLLVTLR